MIYAAFSLLIGVGVIVLGVSEPGTFRVVSTAVGLCWLLRAVALVLAP